MKVRSVKKIDQKHLQCDITTITENFYAFVNEEIGYLIHNSPAVIFGRDENGDFVFTDKSGFSAKGYDGKAKSGKDLEKMLMNRGKGGEKSDSYKMFASNMKNVFDVFEQAVPDNVRGFFKGDLLYFDTPQLKDGHYTFKPNVVRYSVDAESDLGERIGRSKAGVVIHRYIDSDGNEKALQNLDIFEGDDLMVVPPVTVQEPPQIDESKFKELASTINKNSGALDRMLDSATLKQNKITDLSNIFYTYTNNKVDTGLDSLGKDFFDWLKNSKVSQPKQKKIVEYLNEHRDGFQALWNIVSGIMRLKDDIINQFDTQASPIKSKVNDQEGGEGYVLSHPEGDIKMVSREFFTKANRSIERD